MNGMDIMKRQRITLGMSMKYAGRAMDEWLYRQAPCDMRVRRAKTKGMVAVTIESDPKTDGAGAIWASWCVQHLQGVKVDIKDI